MSGAPAGFEGRSLRGAGTTLLLAALLGSAGGVALPTAIGVPAVGVGISLALRGRVRPLGAEYGLLPALAAVGALAVLASPSLLVAALAGGAGLALVLWNAETPGEALPGPDPFGGLALPGLCLAVALLAAFALPAAPADVGGAAIAIVVALGLLAWALGSGGRDSEAPAQTI